MLLIFSVVSWLYVMSWLKILEKFAALRVVDTTFMETGECKRIRMSLNVIYKSIVGIDGLFACSSFL